MHLSFCNRELSSQNFIQKTRRPELKCNRAHKLHRGAKEVGEESPFCFIQFIDFWNDLRVVKPLIAQPLPDMDPVFLLTMGVVILVIGSPVKKA
jgi:hypothetical protein